MNSTARFLISITIAASLMVGLLPTVWAGVTGQISSYKVEITTDPDVIPVGKARLFINLKDQSGKPVTGVQVRALVKMPAMSMGEKETTAQTQPGKPGTYTTEAAFMMAGAFDAAITITGPKGTVTGKIPLETGQSTTGAAGMTLRSLIPWAILAVLVVFIVVRMRQTGQHVAWRSAANRGTVGGVILLIAIFGVSLYAISHWRRPGAMTPLEAQAMEMNTPAPPGAAAVTLAEVTRGPIESTVRYTGQAVGFNEQDVIARTQGWLVWMPFYNGQKVKSGEVVARLDTSQIQPQIAQQEAGVNMSRQGVTVAQKEYRQTLAQINFAHSEEGMLQGSLDEAGSNVDAAREERSNADAMVAVAQGKITDAEAQLRAAKSDQTYWGQELSREKALLSKGAVSVEEYQREQSQATSADAKVQQAQAGLSQANSELQAAQASVRKADAMVRAAEGKVRSVKSELQSHAAHVRSSEAAADAAKAKIEQANAGVQQSQAGLASVATTRGYSEIRAQIDGVVTQRVISQGQLVNPGQAIIRVAQIDPIRLQANVAEVDLDKIQVGYRVVVRGQGNARPPVVATVTSITPTVDPTARTGIVEAVVANRDGRFVPGQFVTMDIATARSQDGLRVPLTAIHPRASAGVGVQAGESTSSVWVADSSGAAGQYTVKPVDVVTGVSDGLNVQIVSGLQAGQKVVVIGADYLKSGDTVYTGDKAPTPAAQPGGSMPGMPGMSDSGTAAPAQSAPSTPSTKNEATIEVSSKGFTPASVSLKAGVPAKLTFIRKDTENCATEVLLPGYGIKKALILNQPVVVEFTPTAGEIAFTCGMNMLSGKVVAK